MRDVDDAADTLVPEDRPTWRIAAEDGPMTVPSPPPSAPPEDAPISRAWLAAPAIPRAGRVPRFDA